MTSRAILRTEGIRLVREFQHETLWIEPWGENSLRVRATKNAEMHADDWALLEPTPTTPDITIEGSCARIVNGRITAEIDEFGWITYQRTGGQTLLQEFWQVKDGGHETSAIELPGRDFHPVMGGDWELSLRFKAQRGERIYGLGQRQIEDLNMKGCMLELAHRNSQASIPFALSSQGYGILWNNPAVGRVTLANNMTEWYAQRTDQLDIWITAGDTPAEIEEAYADATGKVPMMPDYGTGFWQCKLRYKTQDELLRVAHEYKDRGLPISVIVIDFFHWPEQGEWKFDPTYWPDPDGMVQELRDMGIELMVSTWPTVDVNSENWDEMDARGYLVRTERATPTIANFMGNESFYDATHPGAREFVWSKAKANYYDKGIRIFWLDEAEPDLMGHYDFDHIRYHAGPGQKVTNLYPLEYAKTFYEGMEAEGQENIVNLLRCAWAGSQRYGALLWSGDVHSTFETLRRQVSAGLNAGLSGIPWWTTDIGGFTGGNGEDPSFRELLVRWFQFGVYCPVTRLHGFRNPIDFDITDAWRKFGEPFGSGADNELWSYGEDVYRILRDCVETRERLRPYVTEQMARAHECGTPVIRPLFYDFPDQGDIWEVEDQYMFGPDVLVAPVLFEGARNREVVLPRGVRWVDSRTGALHEGGQKLIVDAPLADTPVFVREGAQVLSAIRG